MILERLERGLRTIRNNFIIVMHRKMIERDF
jgi:hypothetical protein